MRIGVVISRIGGVDGVALETEKWLQVLERGGHTVCLLAGEFQNGYRWNEADELLPALSFFSAECKREQEQAFFSPVKNAAPLLEAVNQNAQRILIALRRWIKRRALGVLVLQNATALPSHLSLGVALKELLHTTKIPAIAHNHDFSWERGSRYHTPHAALKTLIKQTFPALSPRVIQVVINEYGRRFLKEHFGTNAVKIPNVMDFSTPFGLITKKRREQLYRFLKLEPNAQLLFQVTRIVRRKGIENAIELVSRLKNPQLKLVIAGDARDDYKGQYLTELKSQVRRLKLRRRVLFAPEVFKRSASASGQTFSIEEAYGAASGVTYFSSYEGFGNAFLEAVLARCPIFVNNYKPVFAEDLACRGFELVKINNNHLTAKAVKAVERILADAALASRMTERNFEIGKQYFSYEILAQRLSRILARLEGRVEKFTAKAATSA